MERKKGILLYLLVMLTLVLGACQSRLASPEPLVETAIVTQEVEATPVEVIQVMTPTPESTGQRTLVICSWPEPETLYPFGASNVATFNVLEGIADGGWKAYEDNSFAYRPVILDKLPSLADGDALLTSVTVGEGDTVVDADGEVVSLDSEADPPQMLNPAGGGEPVPYQGGEFQMEQLSATFKLLPNLLWSDGEPLTAADSVYAFELLIDPDTTNVDKTKLARTARYQANNELTIIWTGLPGFMDSTYYTNFFGPAPEHLWGEYSFAELLEAEESHLKPVGWGPYMIDEWIPGDSITMHKNPNYFRAAEGLPKFDTVVYRFVSENTNANIAALLSGECDVLIFPGTDQPELLLDLNTAGQINATFTTGTVWEHIDFGIQHGDYDNGYQLGVDRPDFFSDVRTRRAFTMCMDRQDLVDTVTFGQSLVIDTYLPPQHPLYNPDVRHYDFDVQAGSALLEEVGWMDDDNDPNTPRIAHGIENIPDGTPLVVTYDTRSGVREQVATIIQGSMAECGIRVNTRIYSSSAELFADGPQGVLFGRNFDLGAFAWGTGVEPPCDLFLSSRVPGPTGETWVSIQDDSNRIFGENGWSDRNIPGFADEEYDLVCNTALSSLPGQDEYETAHLEAQRIFAEQLPIVPLFLRIKQAASRLDMCGLIIDPTNNDELWNIEEFDYGEGCED